MNMNLQLTENGLPMETGPSQDIKFTDEGTDNDAEDIKLTPATIKEIENAHEEFNIQNLQPKTAKHYIRNVTQAIPTNLLYEILYSCNYKYDAEYCPVLLKMKSEDIMED